jgi:hypothetical protein
MPRLIAPAAIIAAIVFLLPDLGSIFARSSSPPPTVVIANSEDSGLAVLLTIVMIVALVAVAAAVGFGLLWFRERGQRRLAETAALHAGVRFHPVIPSAKTSGAVVSYAAAKDPVR